MTVCVVFAGKGRDKADRKRRAQLKALIKLREQKVKDLKDRGEYIVQKLEVQKDLQEFDDALGSDPDEGSSEED